jgi:hypothetical protein
MGTSPVLGVGIGANDADKLFPVVLEQKLIALVPEGFQVINAGLPDCSANSPLFNIFFKNVVAQLNPDIVIVYIRRAPLDAKTERGFAEERALYEKAKRVVEACSWIDTSDTLYAALEFKNPSKEAVYLYKLFLESYLFTGIETARKTIFIKYFNRVNEKTAGTSNEFPFAQTVQFCREKNIKLILIPLFDYSNFRNETKTENMFSMLAALYTDVYLCDLTAAFLKNKDKNIFNDHSHPSVYGHQLIADAIYETMRKKGLLTAKMDKRK